MALPSYPYTKEVHILQLEDEIRNSAITVALDSIVYNEDTYDFQVYFKANLTAPDIEILDGVIEDHDSTPLAPVIGPIVSKLQTNTDTDEIPYVYSTSRPLSHITYFTGAGDDMANPGPAGKGEGPKLIFNMAADEYEKYVDIQFYEDVYIKDGLILAEDAPFGACIDIDIRHPLYGEIETFGKNSPIIGSGWFPMNTEDRAFLPKGLIVRVSVHNSRGAAFGEAEPAAFKVLGRLEMFRPKQ